MRSSHAFRVTFLRLKKPYVQPSSCILSILVLSCPCNPGDIARLCYRPSPRPPSSARQNYHPHSRRLSLQDTSRPPSFPDPTEQLQSATLWPLLTEAKPKRWWSRRRRAFVVGILNLSASSVFPSLNTTLQPRRIHALVSPRRWRMDRAAAAP